MGVDQATQVGHPPLGAKSAIALSICFLPNPSGCLTTDESSHPWRSSCSIGGHPSENLSRRRWRGYIIVCLLSS